MSTSDLTQLGDEDLGAALFTELVDRLDAKAHEDSSIAVVNRMARTFAVSRRGSLLTLSQGIGVRLLRGDLKSKDRRDSSRTFNVGRAAMRSKLAIAPDGIEGTADEILDWIVTMFVDWTTAREIKQPSASERPQVSAPKPSPPAQKRPPAAPRVPQSRPMIREAVKETPPVAAESTQERRPAPRRPIRDNQPTQAVLTEKSVTAPRVGNTPAAKAAPPGPAPTRENTTRTFRTYQLLIETARRELENAKTLPVGGKYFLLSAGTFVAFTVEAFVNDLGSRVIPSWPQLQRLDPLEKTEVLHIELFNAKVDWGVAPYQSVAAALDFKRSLTDAHAETLSYDQMAGADRKESDMPRTRRTAWEKYCDVATIQRWIADVRLLVERFSKAHDPEAPLE
jgi:hypothetical protein